MPTAVLNREPVCAGDDVESNGRPVPVEPTPAIRTAVELVHLILARENYLPSIEGGSTWIARVNGIPAAVVTRKGWQDSLRVYPLRTGSRGVSGDANLYFSYYLANSPERLVADLNCGVTPERRYGEHLTE